MLARAAPPPGGKSSLSRAAAAFYARGRWSPSSPPPTPPRRCASAPPQSCATAGTSRPCRAIRPPPAPSTCPSARSSSCCASSCGPRPRSRWRSRCRGSRAGSRTRRRTSRLRRRPLRRPWRSRSRAPRRSPREGRFAEAIHALLLETLAALSRAARLAPSLTSREIVARVPLPARAREALAGLVAAVERLALRRRGPPPRTTTGAASAGSTPSSTRTGGRRERRVRRARRAPRRRGRGVPRGGGPPRRLRRRPLRSAELRPRLLQPLRRRAPRARRALARPRPPGGRLAPPTPPARAREGAIVALLEPRVGPEDDVREAIVERVNGASPLLLVVLPKRSALPDPARPRWVASAELLPLADRPARPRRARARGEGGPPGEAGDGLPGRAAAPRARAAPAPRVRAPRPAPRERRRRPRRRVGRRGAGAPSSSPTPTCSRRTASRGATTPRWRSPCSTRLGPEALPVVVDETLHGFDQQPSLVRELLRFPLVLATVSALLAAALLAWAAAVRFGRPRPPEPPLAPGKLFLVEASAGLLRARRRRGPRGRAPTCAPRRTR